MRASFPPIKMPAKLAPTLRMNNGYEIPLIGLGTWKGDDILKGLQEDNKTVEGVGEVEQAVRDAIDAGYRHIDTALWYDTEGEVGAAVRAKIAEGVVKREDIFICTKLWNTYHRPDMVEEGCRLSLSKLGLDYIDLYIVHFPFAFKDGTNLGPVDADGKAVLGFVDLLDTWRAMEKLVEKNLVRSIGVSNYNTKQLRRILDNCKIKPAVNQIEVHPFLTQKGLVSFCQENSIVVTAYSPFSSPGRPTNGPPEERLLDNEVLKNIAKRHGKSTGQIALRYLVQRNTVPLPKSVSKKRIFENFDIFDFTLSQNEMIAVDLLDKNARTCTMMDAITHPEYPFSEVI